MAEREEVKLHLGCGKKKIHGYINIDAQKKNDPDVVANVLDLPFEADSVDVIYACHILEHFSKKESLHALEYWHTLLKPGGILRLAVPDLGKVAEHFLLHKDLDSLHALLYGGQKDEYDYHYTGWDEVSLRRDLWKVGFRS